MVAMVGTSAAATEPGAWTALVTTAMSSVDVEKLAIVPGVRNCKPSFTLAYVLFKRIKRNPPPKKRVESAGVVLQ